MLLCWSASHNDTDFDALGRLGADAELVRTLTDTPAVRGHVVLSTCNRFEVYVEVDDDRTDLPVDERFVVHRDAAAAEHLFAVTAGLESVVVGEGEIAGQVRRALTAAQRAGHTSPELERLFQCANQTHRKVKGLTGLGAARPSLIRLALDLAAHRIHDWTTVRVLLIGTGEYAATSLDALRTRGVSDISVWSPSGRGRPFATRHGLSVVEAADVPAVLSGTELVVACSAANGVVLDAAMLSGGSAAGDAECPITEAVCPMGDGRPARVLIDLGLPANIDHAVAGLPDVELLDLAAIRLHAPVEHLAASQDARRVVAEAAASFVRVGSENELAEAVAALRAHVLEAMDAEITRVRKRNDPQTAESAEAALRHFAAVLLHQPSVRARELARTGRHDDYLDALENLFGIERSA